MTGFTDKYRNVVFAILVGVLVLLAGRLLVPFIPAILWASVLTVLMKPLHRRFQDKWSPNVAAIITTFLTLMIVGVPIALVGTAVFFQVNSFVIDLKNAAPTGENGLSLDYLVQELDTTLKPLIQSIAPDFRFVEWFTEHRDEIVRNLTAPAGKAAFTAGYGAFTLVIAFLTMFFMLRDGEKLTAPALELIPLPKATGERILSRLSDTIRAVFVGIVLVAVVQGTVAGITYLALGIPHALLWGVATIVLCVIPLLGAPFLYVPLAIMLFSQGKVAEGAVLLGVGFIVVSNIDNLLRPFIIGAKVDLHPMAVFFSLLGGVLFFGPVGLMAGPMLLTVLLAVIDVLQERMRLEKGDAESEPAPA